MVKAIMKNKFPLNIETLHYSKMAAMKVLYAFYFLFFYLKKFRSHSKNTPPPFSRYEVCKNPQQNHLHFRL